MKPSRSAFSFAVLGLVVAALALISPAQAKIQSTNWFPIGPGPSCCFYPGGESGRATVVAMNPFNIFDVWMGTAGGGVWHTTNADPDLSSSWTWFPTSDNPPSGTEWSLAIGALALGDCNAGGCSRIYAGTGENAIRRDTYYGKGLLIGSYSGCAGCAGSVAWTLHDKGLSLDGTKKWNFTYASINNIVLDPTTTGPRPESQVLYVTLSSGVTASASETTVTAPEPLKNSPAGGYGIYKSRNNGLNWDKLIVPGAEGSKPTDLEIDPDPASHLTLYAGFLGRGIFKSTDGGNNWCPLNPGLPRPSGCPANPSYTLPDPMVTTFDRVELAIEPDPAVHQHLFATFGDCPQPLTDNCKPSVYETSDGGASWIKKWSGTTQEDKKINCPAAYTRYTHGLTIWPGHHETLFLGGVRLCRFDAVNKIWERGDESEDPSTIQGSWIHLDQHQMVFDSTGSHAVVVNDGGVYSSFYDVNDGRFYWKARNDTLQVTEFQSLSGSSQTPRIIGGTQDNSTMLWLGAAKWDNTRCCGDGGYSLLDEDTPANMYSTGNRETFGAEPKRSVNGLAWDSIPSNLQNLQMLADPSSIYYPPMVQAPAPTPSQMPPQHALYYGTNRLWRSDNDGADWTDVSPVLCQVNPQPEIGAGVDVISAIAVAPNDLDRVWVGCYGGKVFATDDALDPSPSWYEIDFGLPGAPITWLAVDPFNRNLAYATVSGYFAGSHVFFYSETAFRWFATPSIADFNFTPANTITIERQTAADPRVLWLGTDKGVYRSPNGGGVWSKYGTGLPYVPVYQIALDTGRDRLFAGTHGRGAYLLTGPSLSNYGGCEQNFLWTLAVFGNGFPPLSTCSMRILREHGSVCAPGSSLIDANNLTIRSDKDGNLYASNGNNTTPYAMACLNGKCLGGKSVNACNLPTDHMAAVVVTCGNQFAIDDISGCAPVVNPPSSWMGLTQLPGGFQLQAPAPQACMTPDDSGGEALAAPAGDPAAVSLAIEPALGSGGVFEFVPSVHSGDGTSRILCKVSVPFTSGDTPSMVMQNAGAAVNASAACQSSGVGAVFMPAEPPEGGEDPIGAPGTLSLQAPGVTGGQLVASIHADPGQANGFCFDLRSLGVPLRSQLRQMRVRFATLPAGAAGGAITLKESSSLGDCSIPLATAAGQTALDIANSYAAAFQAPDLPPVSQQCPAGHNPRDLRQDGDALVVGLASAITICLNDPGVGMSATPLDVCLTDADCDDHNPCTHDVCAAANGQCVHTPEPDGLPCDDASACTVGNACIAGTCGTPITCSDGNSCTTDTCDPATGICQSTPVFCDDANPCTVDSCTASTGQCQFLPQSGATCDDGNACTTHDVCVLNAGETVPTCQGISGCDDGNPCTDDVCDPATGACQNPPVQCDDGNPCTVDFCDTTGTCQSIPGGPAGPGGTCDDGDLCTVGDTCVGGGTAGDPVCQGQPVSCDDANACTNDACDPASGGCLHTPAAIGEVPGLTASGKISLTWTATPGAFYWNTYRGTIPQNMMGSRGAAGPLYDQTCFEPADSHGDGPLVSNDTQNPPLNTGFYYLVSEVNGCGEGGIGRDVNNTAIPNSSPCFVP